MDDSSFKIQYREGELENLIRVRNKYVELIENYISESKNISKNKLLGTLFDTVFYIGICNMRGHSPSVKEIYLSIQEERNTSLRQLEILEQSNVINRISDSSDSRIKRIHLTDKFRKDLEKFIDEWIDPRKQNKMLK
ncbi:MAG: DNA-binding MarR family transcriptional regulator [Gammaproteobacteria bacterium]|jgi:DNA-binding MarR family transcriptional regulator